MNLLTAAGLILFYKRIVHPLVIGLATLAYLAVRASLMIPYRFLAGYSVKRVPPPPTPPPYRGTHTNSGRPLRTFADSINDLEDA